MAVTFTMDQQKVIDTRNKNILVSAAAGSGKTAVLVERIIQRIMDEEHPIDIDKMLVVTFTNAAAAGMKDKISKAILDRLAIEPENTHLQRQAVLVHQAQITTIHSFCLYLIRNHFEAIGLEPDFGVADDATMKLLSAEVMQSVLENAFQKADADFTYMMEFICHAGRESVLEEYIRELFDRAMSMPFPRTWLLERQKDYDFDNLDAFTDTEAGKYLLEHLQKLLKGYARGYDALYRMATEPDGPHMYADTIEKERDFLYNVAQKMSLEDIGALLPNMVFDRLSGKKDPSVHAGKRKYVGDKRGEYKKAILGLAGQFFGKSPQSLAVENAACKRVAVALVNLTIFYMDALAAEKHKRGIIDFHDMEHFALEILLDETETGYSATEIAKSYQELYEEVMVDEYQDSNLVQEYIVSAVSGEELGKHNRFMVGDVKQSIYKFRLARPEIFMEKYHEYEKADPRNGKDIRIDLKKNFRSREEVLAATNSVFEKVMIPELGGIAYDENARLYPGKEYPPAEGMEAELLITTDDKTYYLNDKEWEAYVVAKRIKELVKSGWIVNEAGDGMRQITYSDIVLLFRAPTPFQEAYTNMFALEDIPLLMTSGISSFEAVETQTLLKFLQAVDNPRKDIALYSVCISFFGGMNENEIAKVKVAYNEYLKASGTTPLKSEICLYDMLTYYKENFTTTDLSKKIAILQEKLQGYRLKAEYMTIVELLYDIMQEFHYREYIGIMFDGKQRLDNVELLIEHAKNFGTGGYKGLFAFISYMNQLEKQAIEYGQTGLVEATNAVRVMTIHKSKGLEFPVVFVCGMGQSYAGKGKQGPLLIDNDMGLALDYVNPTLRTKNKTLRKHVLALKAEQENIAEEQRVLYVAMTRAKEKLIMIGRKGKFESIEDYYVTNQETPLFSDIIGAKSYLDLCLLSITPRSPIKVHKYTEANYMNDVYEATLGYEERQAKLEVGLRIAEEQPVSEEYETRFAFQYPYENLKDLHAKTSVSELKKAAIKEENEAVFEAFESQNEKELYPYIPEFMREKSEMTGAERGTAYHRELELMDFAHLPSSVDACKELLQSFQSEGKMSKRQVECINPYKIWHFTQSNLASRMQKAAVDGTLNSEKSFFLGVPANAVNKDFPAEEIVIVQGIIDAYFEEDGEIVLLDYKTDRVEKGQELIDRYSIQMQYYVKALEQGLGKKVKEVILYSLALGEEVKLL